MGFRWDKLAAPVWIGVVNVTPNSFSDGGKYVEAGAAALRVRELVAQGAGIVELGAEASSFFRAGVEPVSGEEQWGRLGPVLERLGADFTSQISNLISQNSELKDGPVLAVDTRLGWVARKALGSGAVIINDISAGTFDEGMLGAVAEMGGGVVLMHIGESFPENPKEDVAGIGERVRDYLAGRVRAAERAGILRERIAVDPGVGFGKTMADNWRLVAGVGALRALGVEVMLGVSRKRFLGTPVLEELAGEWAETMGQAQAVEAWWQELWEEAHARDVATAAATVLAWRRGVRVHRVHNVGLCAAVLQDELRRRDDATS